MANTPFPLGVNVGGPNGSDPAVQAQWDVRFKSFVDTLGAQPQFMNAYLPDSHSISQWGGDAGWVSWSWEQSPLARGLTPVIGLPLGTQADKSNPGAVYRDFASGKYDSVLRDIVSQWSSHGFKDLYFRPGYEFNTTYTASYAGDDAQTRSDWLAAFKHVADVLHSAPGANTKIIWNPNVQSWNGSLDVKTLYPGDKYVDQIGADLYGPVYPADLYDWSKNDGSFNSSIQEWSSKPANLIHYWNYPDANSYHPTGDGQGNPLSLQSLIDFAKEHGKPLAIPETGAGSDGSHGPYDDGTFPLWMSDKLASSGVNVSMVNVWDFNAGDHDWTFSGPGANRPSEAAAWGRAFGGGGGSAPVTAASEPASSAPVTGDGGQTLVLHLSEDKFQGDASFSVSVDGKTLGSAQDVTASHGAGKSQAFAFTGVLGSGDHDIAVSFLNDRYDGTPSTDRNLYVDSIDVGDTQYGSASATLLSAETQHFYLSA